MFERFQEAEDVVATHVGTPVFRVADDMDAAGVGCVVVVDDKKHPVGIVTDRDLLCRVVATGADPEKTTASEIMSVDPVTGRRDEELTILLERMAEHAIRRLPLVDDEGKLSGMVTTDDLVRELSKALQDIDQAAWRGLRESRHGSRGRRRLEYLVDTIADLDAGLNQLGTRARRHAGEELRAFFERIGLLP